jgi:hypothetical protein
MAWKNQFTFFFYRPHSVSPTPIIHLSGSLDEFYTQQHKYYCSIDLHARKMHICVLDPKGKTKEHQNIKTDPEKFFEMAFLYLDVLSVLKGRSLGWNFEIEFTCAYPRVTMLNASFGQLLRHKPQPKHFLESTTALYSPANALLCMASK